MVMHAAKDFRAADQRLRLPCRKILRMIRLMPTRSLVAFILIGFSVQAHYGAAFAGTAEGMAAAERQDFATAFRELKPAAEQGDSEAQFALGFMYETGEGVPEDDVKAAQWYEKAAQQGEPNAQNNLGLLYAFGKGVRKDLVQAYFWFDIAAENSQADFDRQNAIKSRDAASNLMTRAEVGEAERLVKNWKPRSAASGGQD